MTQAADQELLLRDLWVRLDAVTDAEALTRVMAEMLRSLLRRQGDGEFLAMIQDAFIEGIAGRPFSEQRDIAREIVRVVIDKRPEIALAWQALHRIGPDTAAQRRAADRIEVQPLPASVPAPASPAQAPAFFEFIRAEVLVGHYVADVLDRRLGLFRAAEPRFPSFAYRHGPQFFLFDPAFAKVLRRFVTDVLMEQCRTAMQRHLYRQISPEILNDDQALPTLLAEKRPDTWRILIERLIKLGAQHFAAEGKLAAGAKQGSESGEEFTEVEIPVTRPRTFKVLGVSFSLGQRTTTRRKRVRVKSSTEPSGDEMEALTLITRLRNMAADAGIELPPGCDFGFLRTLLEFDARKYAASCKELLALADHPETTRAYLFERLAVVEQNFDDSLSDAMALMLFAQSSEGGFGFKDLYDVCIGTGARDAGFLLGEIGRRPSDLAFQVRDVLKRGYDETTLANAVRMLLEASQIMARSRFQAELDSSLTVLAAFPVAFAGDEDEAAFSHIGHLLHRALTAPSIEVQQVVDTIIAIYAPVAQRMRDGIKR